MKSGMVAAKRETQTLREHSAHPRQWVPWQRVDLIRVYWHHHVVCNHHYVNTTPVDLKRMNSETPWQTKEWVGNKRGKNRTLLAVQVLFWIDLVIGGRADLVSLLTLRDPPTRYDGNSATMPLTPYHSLHISAMSQVPFKTGDNHQNKTKKSITSYSIQSDQIKCINVITLTIWLTFRPADFFSSKNYLPVYS